MNRILAVLLLIAGFPLVTPPTQASTFELESTTIILKEADGAVTFNVKNTGNDPILLLTTLENLSNDNSADRLLASPPITRIDPGDTQLIRFSLKPGTALSEERLIKAAFEGVTQVDGAKVAMPIRQEIGMILQPKRIVPVPRPWEDLRWVREGDELVLSNPGKHVVRAAPQVTVLPSGATVPLGQPYLRAGETLRRPLPAEVAAVDSIKVVPLSRYGFVLPEAVITPAP